MASAVAFLLCDLVWIDPISHNQTILGVFTGPRGTKFPTPFREFSAYVLLVGDPGEVGELNLACTDETGDDVLDDWRARLIIGPEGKAQVHIRLGEFSFPKEGRYRFVLTFDSHLIGELSIPVFLRGKPQ